MHNFLIVTLQILILVVLVDFMNFVLFFTMDNMKSTWARKLAVLFLACAADLFHNHEELLLPLFPILAFVKLVCLWKLLKRDTLFCWKEKHSSAKHLDPICLKEYRFHFCCNTVNDIFVAIITQLMQLLQRISYSFILLPWYYICIGQSLLMQNYHWLLPLLSSTLQKKSDRVWFLFTKMENLFFF